tara:strand:- start:1583 stop:4174 length:2592 start_codon:yes stop_codon:yes gene_type:complete
MVLGAIARGVIGRAGRGSKMAGSVFKREVPASEQTVDVKATPVVQSSTPLISSSSTFNAKDINKASPSIGTETLEGTAFRIKTSLVDVDTLLRGSIALDELKEKSRKKRGEEKEGKDREKKLESATKKNSNKFGLGKLIPTKAKSIFGNIINFFVTLLLGKVLMGLLDNPQAFAKLAIGLAAVANFVIDWGGKLFNAFVNLIGFGYGIYDGLRGTVGNLFGEAGLKTFDNLSKTFNLLLTTALIAAMTAGRAGMLGGGGPGLGGLTRVGGARGVKPAAVTRYAQRFGRNAAVKRFGEKAVQRYGGTAARSTLTKLGRKGLTSILGKTGSKTFLKTVKRFVSPTVRGIPIIGTLIDFALNLLVFKEPVGKAAFKAIGAGLAAWMGGAIGSIIPGAGTLVGAVLGGWAGDALGGLMYDVFFGKQTLDAAKDDEDESAIQTKSKGLSETMLTGGGAGAITALQKGKIKAPKIKPKPKPKPKRPQIRGKKPGSKAVKQFKKSFTKQRQKLTKAVRPVTRALKPVTQKATKAITKNIVKPATKVATSASKSLTKNIVKPASKVATTTTKAVAAAAKGATKGATTAGKAGLKAVSGTLKAAKKIISPIVKKIPFLGPLVDFLLNVFVFKEPLGRSAFMAVGAGLGTWVGGALGTLVPLPGIGTAIGMFLGGAGGDLLGGLLYDKIFADKDPKENGDKKDKKDKDLKVDGDDSGTTERTSQSFTTSGGPEAEQLKNQMAESRQPKRTTISSEMDPEVAAKRLELESRKNQVRRIHGRDSDEYKNIQSQIAELRSGSPISSNQKTNDYSGLNTYASYDKAEGSTTYVVTQKVKPSTNTGRDQGVGGEKEMAALSMSSSGSSSNPFKELQKR